MVRVSQSLGRIVVPVERAEVRVWCVWKTERKLHGPMQVEGAVTLKCGPERSSIEGLGAGMASRVEAGIEIRRCPKQEIVVVGCIDAKRCIPVAMSRGMLSNRERLLGAFAGPQTFQRR